MARPQLMRRRRRRRRKPISAHEEPSRFLSLYSPVCLPACAFAAGLTWPSATSSKLCAAAGARLWPLNSATTSAISDLNDVAFVCCCLACVTHAQDAIAQNLPPLGFEFKRIISAARKKHVRLGGARLADEEERKFPIKMQTSSRNVS